MVQSVKPRKSHKPATQKRIRRKALLIAPACREDCQVNHTVDQTAALLQASRWQVEQLIKAGKLPTINCGLGLARKSRRIPHSAIRALIEAS